MAAEAGEPTAKERLEDILRQKAAALWKTLPQQGDIKEAQYDHKQSLGTRARWVHFAIEDAMFGLFGLTMTSLVLGTTTRSISSIGMAPSKA